MEFFLEKLGICNLNSAGLLLKNRTFSMFWSLTNNLMISYIITIVKTNPFEKLFNCP